MRLFVILNLFQDISKVGEILCSGESFRWLKEIQDYTTGHKLFAK